MAEKAEVPDEETYNQLVGSVFVGGAVSSVMSLAQQTGVVKVLTEASQPMTSTDIAAQLRLKERYTHEMLSCLAAMRLIQVERGTGGQDQPPPQFRLLPQHRHAFHKTAVFTIFNSLAASRFTDIRANCYLDAPEMDLQYGDEVFYGLSQVNEFTKELLTNAILKTPGLKDQLENGVQALEIGCGPAILSCHMAAMFPNTHFLLTDVTHLGVDRARQTAKERNVSNVDFQILDVFEIPDEWHDRFDWVFVCDVIHDLPYPLKALEAIRKVLKPGGHFSMLDMFMGSSLSENVGNPSAAALYTYGTFMCLPASYQKPDSEALGPCWGKQRACALVEKAGLHVLDLIDSTPDNPGVLGLCMCQKPSEQQR